MRVNLNNVIGFILLIKNLLIILLLVVISPLDTEVFEGTSRLLFVLSVGALTLLSSDLEMRLLNWIVRVVKAQRKG